MRLRLSLAGPIQAAKTISAITLLKRAGMPLIDAKRAIERVLDNAECWVEIPGDASALDRELAAVGFRALPDDASVFVGSGNYLADRGYADPEETRVKFLLYNEVALARERRGLERPTENVSSVSIGILVQELLKLGRDVTICVSEAGSDEGRFDVAFIGDER